MKFSVDSECPKIDKFFTKTVDFENISGNCHALWGCVMGFYSEFFHSIKRNDFLFRCLNHLEALDRAEIIIFIFKGKLFLRSKAEGSAFCHD